MREGPQEFRELFPTGYIPIILANIFQAGETLRKKTPNEIENKLTRRLCIKMNQLPGFRDGPLSLHPQQELLPSEPDSDSPEGYVDILVSCGYGSETYFAIEAKRLRVRSAKGKMNAGNNDYVNEGMMRFVSGQYAPFMVTSAMLGYVYDGDIRKARSGIGRYIKGKIKELKLMPPEKLKKSSLVATKEIHETRHELTDRIFCIYHVLLGV
ncbi:hypothetical protein [uncultured Desulfosarcina sp.]|uniref:hypothetical protein n=1 Tax=uncultured Desulfosarcina sp. TaxID=218289 RepID=UPI0029C71BD2|nr:hypothetical protein [uncultured Desulfosarcina sp.]